MKSISLKLLLIIIFCFFTVSYTNDIFQQVNAKGVTYLENRINNALNSCYANEGSYPDNLTYLVDNYNVIIGDNYNVFYEGFSSNIRPKVKVVYLK